MPGPRLAGLRAASVLAHGAVLLGGTVLCGMPTLWWAWAHSGGNGLWAAGAAAGLCLLGAWLALGCMAWFHNPQNVLPGVLLGMGFRSGLPLGCGLCLYLLYPPLAQAGLLYYLVVFYLPLLALGTYLSLPKPSVKPSPLPSSGESAEPASNLKTVTDDD